MTKIIFVHGMNGTSESWSTVPELLKAAGYDVGNVDLPGHHKPLSWFAILLGDTGRYKSGLSMDDYVDAIVAEFPKENERNVVLVGHSMGGAVISHVAQRYPERIAQVIYVAAMLPDTGDSPASIIEEIKKENVPKWKTVEDFRPHFQKLHLVYEPEEPLLAVFSRTPAFDALPRGYVLCQDDDVVPAALQQRMLDDYDGASTKTEVVRLPRSHFPQYVNPKELFGTIKTMLVA